MTIRTVVATLALVCAALSTSLAQETVITDDTPVERREIVSPFVDSSSGQAESQRRESSSGTMSDIELIVGMTFFVGVLLWSFLRWQARQGRRR